MTNAEIRDALNRVANEMRELGEKAEWTAEDQAKFDKLTERSNELDKRLALADKLAEMDKPQESIGKRQVPGGAAPDVSTDPDYEEVFGKYVRFGLGDMTEIERRVLRSGFSPGEGRAQTAGGTTAGGYTVPYGPMQRLEKALLDYGGVLEASKRLYTSDGRTLQIPTINDTSKVGRILAENTAATEDALVFGQKTLGAIKFSSDLVLASNEFLTDTAIDAEGEIAELLGIRLGRTLAPYLINGDGVSEPEGLDMAVSFYTAAGAAAITRADIVNLIHKVDPAHRRSPDFKLVFNDSTLSAIKLLAVGTGDDRPLWQPSMRDGEPSTVEGVPYVVDQGCADIGAGLHSAYAVDFRQFWVRQAGPIRLVREGGGAYATTDQVAFVALARWDSVLVDPGSNAAAYLRHPAS